MESRKKNLSQTQCQIVISMIGILFINIYDPSHFQQTESHRLCNKFHINSVKHAKVANSGV